VTSSATTTVGSRDFAGLWLLAIVASAAVGTHGIVYWDAGDYVRLAVDGGTSGLALGRPLFLYVSHLVVSIVDPAFAEIVLRWFWTVFGATAAPALAVLASRLGLDRPASIAAGLALALSPSFAHTNHQVLTDTPALALSIAALIAATSSQAVLAGLILAAAIATRETSAVHIVSIAILLGLGRKTVLAMLALAVALAAILLMFPPPGLASWWQLMAQSTVDRAASPSGVFKSLLWVLAAGPIPVVAGIFVLARRSTGRWLIVSVPCLIATAGLLFYPDGSFSPRYVLATAPLAFFMAGGILLSAWPRLSVAALVVSLAVVPFITQTSRLMATRGAAVMQRIRILPAGAIVVPGHYCPQAQLAASVYQRRDLSMVCPGWGWPADLSAVLDAARIAGHPVAVDVSDDAWRAPGETPHRDATRQWLDGKSSQLVAGFNVVSR
jgi:hypothetical protein